MKPANFPARKLARQLSAKFRTETGGLFIARWTATTHPQCLEARQIRTKKRRASV
jgi:hypothetical protein